LFINNELIGEHLMPRSSACHHAASTVAAALLVLLPGLPVLVPAGFANGSLPARPAALPELA
jgi:hypothetical protein